MEEFRSSQWDYYRQWKAYQAQPTQQEKERLSKVFDQLFSPTRGYADLDHRIALSREKKSHLLAVLDYPKIPLHNNEAELAVREDVVKLKISNGTRSSNGTKAWDI